MKKNVWIINHYASDTFFDKGGRHYWFCKYLKAAGYNPVLFVANSVHGSMDKSTYFKQKELYKKHIETTLGIPYIFVKTRGYCGNGISRIINMFQFCFNTIESAKYIERCEKRKPDIIVASSVHPLSLIAGLRLAKHFNVPCICEIRDLWPESIVAYSQSWTKDSLLIKFLYEQEKKIYTKCDALVFTMEGGYQYIIDKGWDDLIPSSKVYYINNGVDLNNYITVNNYIAEERNTSFKVIYTGSLRSANDVGFLLESAKEINDNSIIFEIYGSGDNEEQLRKKAVDEEIKNVVFKGKVPKSEIPKILSTADLLVLHMIPSPIQKYGLSLNKLFEYFAAKKPVLLDASIENNPVVSFNAGISIPNASPKQFADEILRFASMDSSEYLNYCNNSYKAAQYYDFSKLTNLLIDVIESL